MNFKFSTIMVLLMFCAFLFFAVEDAKIHGDRLSEWTRAWIAFALWVIAVIIAVFSGDDEDEDDIDRNT